MQKEESLAQKMEESSDEFRKQFDPNSPNYHGGIQTVVPTGGDRVPESMPTMYPEGYNPNQAQEAVDYGEEYKKVETVRGVYVNLKKQLAKLGPIVEAFLRHDEIFKQKGDPNNEKHVKAHQQSIQKEQVALQSVQDLLKSFIPTLEEMDAESKQTAKELSQIIFESGKKYDSKETLANFNFRVKKLSTKTFSMAQKYLQRLKDIKKEHANKQKQVQTDKKEEAQ